MNTAASDYIEHRILANLATLLQSTEDARHCDLFSSSQNSTAQQAWIHQTEQLIQKVRILSTDFLKTTTLWYELSTLRKQFKKNFKPIADVSYYNQPTLLQQCREIDASSQFNRFFLGVQSRYNYFHGSLIQAVQLRLIIMDYKKKCPSDLNPPPKTYSDLVAHGIKILGNPTFKLDGRVFRIPIFPNLPQPIDRIKWEENSPKPCSESGDLLIQSTIQLPKDSSHITPSTIALHDQSHVQGLLNFLPNLLQKMAENLRFSSSENKPLFQLEITEDLLKENSPSDDLLDTMMELDGWILPKRSEEVGDITPQHSTEHEDF
jgi:hypothetical protein